MKDSVMLKNRASYTADTEDISVNVKNLKAIIFGLSFLQNGAGAPTLATLLTHTNTLKMTVGGSVESLIRFDDLAVLNVFLRNKPFYLLSAGDNQFGVLQNVVLPVEMSTDKKIYVKLTRTGLATIDTELLTLSAISGDKPFPANPMSLQYIGDNTQTTPKDFDISVAGKYLVGLLIFNTTIPVAATSADFTVGELKFKVNTKERGHYTADMMETAKLAGEETAWLGVCDNYRFIDLSEDPLPAGDLKANIKSYSAATDAFRLIGIYK